MVGFVVDGHIYSCPCIVYIHDNGYATRPAVNIPAIINCMKIRINFYLILTFILQLTFMYKTVTKNSPKLMVQCMSEVCLR